VVVDLLKLSLFSNTPLTDLILKKNQFVDNIYQSKKYEFGNGEKQSDTGRYMVVKLMVRKSTRVSIC
jgi:hypothetical protein